MTIITETEGLSRAVSEKLLQMKQETVLKAVAHNELVYDSDMIFRVVIPKNKEDYYYNGVLILSLYEPKLVWEDEEDMSKLIANLPYKIHEYRLQLKEISFRPLTVIRVDVFDESIKYWKDNVETLRWAFGDSDNPLVEVQFAQCPYCYQTIYVKAHWGPSVKRTDTCVHCLNGTSENRLVFAKNNQVEEGEQ